MNQENYSSDESEFGIFVDCSLLWEECEEETSLYETLRAFAEASPERELFALIRTEREDCTETTVKAIFRAAVYGNISLLFGNIFNNSDLEEAKECANRAFRSLLEEGHEFNGFLPKGILLDTPLALLSEISEQGLDFFCLDEERLSSLFTGGVDCRKESAKEFFNGRIEKNRSSALRCYTLLPESINSPETKKFFRKFQKRY